MSYYHATLEDRGSKTLFNQGGNYEKIVDGKIKFHNKSCGVPEISNSEQLCASKKPECALFSKIYNFNNKTGSPAIFENYLIFLYSIDKKPDLDLSNLEKGDFQVIKEVRYEKPEEKEIKGEKYAEVSVGLEASSDVSRCYKNNFYLSDKQKARRVIKELRNLIEKETYNSPF